jgi:4-phospho-D-threonate 3-dehydrogenase / 4-phospho-D-erythronate 3-dehydrogenase
MTPLKPVLGLTMGDPAGIGPEICLRALRQPSVLKVCTPVLFGDAGVLKRLQRDLDCRVTSSVDFAKHETVHEPLAIDCGAIDPKRVQPGKISRECGRAGFIYIEKAIQMALAKKIDGVVTAPIHKEALHLAGVKFPGHTEIFTALTNAKRSCMMLYSDKITVSLVTTHIGFSQVPKRISARRIIDVIELTAHAMRRILRRAPKLAICGLNPHAGESGLFGNREEEKFIEPAVGHARNNRISVEGPLAPDAAFTNGQRKKFDAIICLYHDQGHIPFKMLAFDTGVNVTLGLPIVRTSVDHGTAFDIAWQGRASATSLFSAIEVAAELARTAKKEKTAKKTGRQNNSLFLRHKQLENGSK